MKTFWHIASFVDFTMACVLSWRQDYAAAALFMALACFAEIQILKCRP